MTSSYYLLGDGGSDLDGAQSSGMSADGLESFDAALRLQQSCTLPTLEDDLASNDTTGI